VSGAVSDMVGNPPFGVAALKEDVSVSDGKSGEALETLWCLFTLDHLEKLKARIKYETALLVAALPHLIFKNFLLQYGAMCVFRNLAYSRHVQGARLKDLGFEWIPESDNDFWSEFFLYLNGAVALLAVSMPLLSNHAHQRGVFSVDVFLEIVNIQCVGHLLRFFTFISTSLPGPAAHCQAGAPLYRHEGFTWYEIFTRRSRVHVDPNCGDLIFSGHMFQNTCLACVILANIRNLVPNRILGNVFSSILILTVVVQPYFIIAARNHYTVDVVISLYVAPLLWWALEGFYATSVCAKCIVWISFFVPKYVLNYLKVHSPRLASSLEEETATAMPNSDATSEALQYLLEKYDMDLKDTKLLLSFNNKTDCGNGVMNDHSNNADVADVEAAAPVLRRKGL
jgi:hypothetical protein